MGYSKSLFDYYVYVDCAPCKANNWQVKRLIAGFWNRSDYVIFIEAMSERFPERTYTVADDDGNLISSIKGGIKVQL